MSTLTVRYIGPLHTQLDFGQEYPAEALSDGMYRLRFGPGRIDYEDLPLDHCEIPARPDKSTLDTAAEKTKETRTSDAIDSLWREVAGDATQTPESKTWRDFSWEFNTDDLMLLVRLNLRDDYPGDKAQAYNIVRQHVSEILNKLER